MYNDSKMAIIPLPTRVSRLYPVFALTFALSTSVFGYAWGSSEIELLTLSHTYETRDESLRSQVTALTRSQKETAGILITQRAQVTQTASQLASIKTQLTQQSADLEQKKAALVSAQNQVSANATELQQLRSRPPLFSFANHSSLTDVTTKQAQVKELVANAYTYIQNIYGQPYLLNSITITFVDQYQIAGSAGEILISNGSKGISIDIHLKDFNKYDFQDSNTVIHEMIHGFHGVAVFQTSAIEEGMTVAATDAVMANMTTDHMLPDFGHLYLETDAATYATLNRSLRIPANNELLYASSDVSDIYQLIGSAWYSLYKQDSQAFKKINTYYYAHVQKGEIATTALALQAISDSVPTLKGQPIAVYLAANTAFHPK